MVTRVQFYAIEVSEIRLPALLGKLEAKEIES